MDDAENTYSGIAFQTLAAAIVDSVKDSIQWRQMGGKVWGGSADPLPKDS